MKIKNKTSLINNLDLKVMTLLNKVPFYRISVPFTKEDIEMIVKIDKDDFIEGQLSDCGSCLTNYLNLDVCKRCKKDNTVYGYGWNEFRNLSFGDEDSVDTRLELNTYLWLVPHLKKKHSMFFI